MTETQGRQRDNMQDGQQPRWQPAGPSPAAVSAVRWMVIGTVVMVVVRMLGVIGAYLAGAVASITGIDSLQAVSGLIAFFVVPVSGLVSLILLVIAIITIVQARDRGRRGAIIVAVTLTVGAVLFAALYVLWRIVLGTTDPSAMSMVSGGYNIAELIRTLIVLSALVIGARMSRRWAKQLG